MAVMVTDHAGEVLCTSGCVFEDILKITRMGKTKNKGGGKKRKMLPKRTYEGYSLVRSK